MNKPILLFCFILLSASAIAQTKKLPVQGKLFENNLPVNGTRNLGFSIATIGWNQTLNNVPVSEGLYTVELDVPADLFAAQASHDLDISVNGTPLSTVKIHAPIESDPTVLAFLKDGVSWDEVTDKPATIDLDPTNELQTLTLTGTTLSISGGSAVNLPTGGGSGAGVFDTLLVGPPKLATVTSPSVLSGSQSDDRQTVTQTFIAESTGRLVSIEVWCANSNIAGIDFKVRPVSGQSIADNFFPPAAFSPVYSYQTFTPSSSNAPLTQYTQYIIEFTVSGGSTYGFGYDPGDPYKFGQSDIVPGNGADLKFKVNIEKTVGPSMQIDTNGYVGIGTSNPTSTLTVNGRIEDKTGFIMPVGTILAYAGTNISLPPKGWLFCDGGTHSRVEFADLFNAIGTAWGEGNGTTSFRAPDLRGEFIRGWDRGTGNDPNNATRYAKYGGATMDVGSYQLDASQDWKATFYSRSIRQDCSTPNVFINSGGCGDAPGSGPSATQVYKVTIDPANATRVSSETRPRNAAVIYIIKY